MGRSGPFPPAQPIFFAEEFPRARVVRGDSGIPYTKGPKRPNGASFLVRSSKAAKAGQAGFGLGGVGVVNMGRRAEGEGREEPWWSAAWDWEGSVLELLFMGFCLERLVVLMC
jgi:hypothetical protein